MKSIKTIIAAASVLGGVSVACQAYAQQEPQQEPQHAKHHAALAPAMKVDTSAGEVKKIDKRSGKITIQHGPLRNLGMPGMTMAFKVKDRAMLDTVQVGDKINFVAEKVNGSLTLTQWEASK